MKSHSTISDDEFASHRILGQLSVCRTAVNVEKIFLKFQKEVIIDH